MTEIKRDGELSYITRTAPILRGTARREAQAKAESMSRRPAKDGDEQDVFTGWRHALCYLDRAGKAKAVKVRHNRRKRRQVRQQLKGERP